MRHFGCAFCRQHLIELKKAYGEIKEAGGDIVAIFQYGAEATERFCEAREIPYRVLSVTRCARATPRWSSGAAASGSTSAGASSRAGRGPRAEALRRPPQGDAAQRPGTFVVDSSGRVVLAHYNQHSTDNVPVERVVAAVRQAGAGTPTAA